MDIYFSQMRLFRLLIILLSVSFLISCSDSDSDEDDAQSDTFLVSGVVSGLQGTLSLTNNNLETLILSQPGTFNFTTALEDGSNYSVTVLAQPAGAICTVNNGAGTVNGAAVTDILVDCSNLDYSISGSIEGLQGDILLLNNGVDSLALNSNGLFNFSQLLNHAEDYNVSIQNQPVDQLCSIANGSGTINADDVSDISISCANLYNLGGTVTGLTGTLAISNNGIDSLVASSNGSYVFDERIASGDIYNVQITQNPSSQICSVTNANGQVAEADITNVDIFCTADTTSVTLSGSYQVVPLTQVDSDINDALAVPNVSNNETVSAQAIPNFSTIHGFATAQGTGRVAEGDRFSSSSDLFDIYSVNLQSNQTIRMQVVDYAGDDEFQGDLDLYLFDNNADLVDSSQSVGEYEEITVPANGAYFIAVFAYEGTSKYTLSLDSITSNSLTSQGSVDFKIGEAIVKFKQGAASGFRATNQSVSLSHQQENRSALARFESLQPFNQTITGPNSASEFIEELAARNPISLQKFETLQQVKKLSLRSDVEYAEPNYLYHPLLVPNDEYYGLQWHYPQINLPQAWDITTGDSDVIVAVVDTGVFLAHPEFDGQLVTGYDFISDVGNAADGNGIDSNPDDPGDSSQLNNSSWHGTHVAGTIAARSNNSSGIAGIAWQAKIMPLRVLGTEGGSGYDIIQSIRYAAGLSNDSNTVPTQKADIINLSLGGGGYSQSAQAAYDAVRAEGVIVVAAAGNENSSQFSYPASYDGVISVSATDFNNDRAPYSNFGSRVDVAAPGGNTGTDLNNDGYADGVLSSLVDDSSGTRAPTYSFYQGTSMAAPHVAGVFALMRAVHPTISPDEIEGLLSAGSITTDLGDAGRDDIYGHGLIDALAAVQAAQLLENGGEAPQQPAVIVAAPNQLTMVSDSNASLTVSNEGGEDASILNVVTNASWLSASPVTVDVNGLGDYSVTIDRSGLSDSLYLGTITFILSTGSSLEVQVTMMVGSVNNDGVVSQIYLLLLDESSNVIDNTLAVDQGNGVYDYSFSNVTPGIYRIVGGSDIDNDNFICQLSEACGGYPTVDELSDIEVINTDIPGLDFLVDILSNFGTSGINSTNETNREGFRLPDVISKQLAQ